MIAAMAAAECSMQFVLPNRTPPPATREAGLVQIAIALTEGKDKLGGKDGLHRIENATTKGARNAVSKALALLQKRAIAATVVSPLLEQHLGSSTMVHRRRLWVTKQTEME